MQKWEQNEEKKRYLRSYQAAIRREREICEEIQRLRESRIFPALQMPDGMPRGSGGYSDLSEYAVMVEREIEKLGRAKHEQARLYLEIRRAIRRVKDDDEREVLWLKYIQGLTWEQVVDRLPYQWTKMHEIHGRALANFRIPKKNKNANRNG